MKIDTQRRFGDLTSTGEEAASYVNLHRDRRVKRGQIFMRRCVVIFAGSLIGVGTATQYSLLYYGCWCCVYLSFFLMMPSVLPTDNTKIKIANWVGVWNMSLGACFAVHFAHRKYLAVDECVTMYPRWLCRWNVVFWTMHIFNALANAGMCFQSSRYQAPAASLHHFWWAFGCYFTFLALTGFTDLGLETLAGKYNNVRSDDTDVVSDSMMVATPGRKPCFYGKFAILCVQLIIGRLCHCKRFKMYMWRYAASHASISLRTDDAPILPETVVDSGPSETILTRLSSVTLYLSLAVAGGGSTGTSPTTVPATTSKR